MAQWGEGYTKGWGDHGKPGQLVPKGPHPCRCGSSWPVGNVVMQGAPMGRGTTKQRSAYPSTPPKVPQSLCLPCPGPLLLPTGDPYVCYNIGDIFEGMRKCGYVIGDYFCIA